MKRVSALIGTVVAASLVSGCTVTHGGVNGKAAALQHDIEMEVGRQQPNSEPRKNPLYKRIHAVYVGTRSAAIANNAALPPAINEMSFQLQRRVNLATAAKNIQKMTRYPVRINPDVYARAAQAIDARRPDQDASNLLSATVPDGDTSLPTDFDGPLKDYLDTIAAQLNINWEFDANKGFYFYRYVTKVFEVKLHAADNKYDIELRKGTQASTGASGTSVAQSSSSEAGGYSSSTSQKSAAYYSPWGSLKTAIEAVIAPTSKVAIDISSNSVIVRGTRDEVEEAERIVMRANEVHNRLVTLTLRIMRVQYDNSSQAGADFQAAYARLMAGGVTDYRLNFSNPSSLVGADGGGFGYKIVNPQSRWSGTQGLVQAINQLGTIVSDTTESYPVMNRRTIPVAGFDTDTYLAETTPASGGVLGGTGGGIPGLRPGTLTTGFFLSMTPTAYDDGTVWLEMSLDQSEKRGPFGTASTGSGDTFQQIQLPNTHVDTKSPSVAVKAGETLMLVNSNRSNDSHTRKAGLLGASGAGESRREVQIILVTPYVRTL